MELTVLIIAICSLVVSLAVLGVCIYLVRRKPDNTAAEATQRALEDAVRREIEAVNANTALLLNGYSATLDSHMQTYEARQTQMGQDVQRQMSEMAGGMQRTLQAQRMEMAQTFETIRAALDAKQAQSLTLTQERLDALRTEVAGQLVALREDNNKQLERMRKVVDQELQDNLQTKLSQSFQMISENLQKVSQSMGEMQSMTAGMNDLKRVLSGVKTRGIWGEASLSFLLSEILSPDQYTADFRPSPRSERNVVEFAVRLPGRQDNESVYLPIDSKFPREDYERLVEAADLGDKAGMEAAGKALEKRIREEATDIKNKYIRPPRTTEFAILYVPIEGLYAEVLRRPGLMDALRQEYNVLLAGPTTLAALLNSLQVGFTTLAVEKRSKEIWELLAKTQRLFKAFTVTIQKAENQVETLAKTLHKTGDQSRNLHAKLSNVHQLEQYAEAAADDAEDAILMEDVDAMDDSDDE